MSRVRVYIPGFDIPKDRGVKYGDYTVFYDEVGNALIVDAGQRPASAVLRTWIKKQKFNRIWMVATHPHTDHVNGVIDSINDSGIKVEKVWMTKYDSMKQYTDSKYRSKQWYSLLCRMYDNCAKGLYDLCVRKGIQVGWLSTGTHIRIGDIHCKVLWQGSYKVPDSDDQAGMYINNFSPLLLFDFGYFVAGDNMLGCASARNCLKKVIMAQIPHHGNYVDKVAFEKLSPKAALYNYGEKNGTIGKDKGFTSWTIPVVQRLGADIWNNFTDGAICMTFTESYVVVCGDRKDRTKLYNLDSYKNWSRSNTELACEVMLCMHGNGDARKNALGTRYAAVQEIVGAFVEDKDLLIDSLADYVIMGLAGNGDDRRRILGGYYLETQARVNERFS